MLKFIFKIINKIRDLIEIQDRKILEFSIKNLCSRITNKYRDIKLRCYYDKLDINLFVIHVNEIYANNTGFKEYINKEFNYFETLFPNVLIMWGHFDPVDYRYYDPKQYKLLYKYGS